MKSHGIINHVEIRDVTKVPKGIKVGDYYKKFNGPIGSIIIRYLMKVFVADGDGPAYFTFFEDCALYFRKEMLTRSWKKWKNRPEEVSKSKNSSTSVDDNIVQEDHVVVIEETSSSSTMSEITPQRCSRDSDLSRVDSSGGDLQFSSTRVLKK
ncbi:hypothetical protein OROMI_021818 [Orobanche minor]